jgi:hypothetical protein
VFPPQTRSSNAKASDARIVNLELLAIAHEQSSHQSQEQQQLEAILGGFFFELRWLFVFALRLC